MRLEQGGWVWVMHTHVHTTHKYKNKVTRENEVETDNSSRFMKNVHKVLKYRKKDNDYDLLPA